MGLGVGALPSVTIKKIPPTKINTPTTASMIRSFLVFTLSTDMEELSVIGTDLFMGAFAQLSYDGLGVGPKINHYTNQNGYNNANNRKEELQDTHIISIPSPKEKSLYCFLIAF